MGGHIDRKTIGIEGVSEWKERNLKRDEYKKYTVIHNVVCVMSVGSLEYFMG